MITERERLKVLYDGGNYRGNTLYHTDMLIR